MILRMEIAEEEILVACHDAEESNQEMLAKAEQLAARPLQQSTFLAAEVKKCLIQTT